MKLFKSLKPNTFHYITAVTFGRTQVFRSDVACQLFINTLAEIRSLHPFKLVGYVIMPDHIHMIINPQFPEISVILRKIKGKSARIILDQLIAEGHSELLSNLKIDIVKRDYAVWQKDSSAIDLFSDKFLRQKLDYIHMNPVRARLCEAPEDWKWSSYAAYFPKAAKDIPIDIDLSPYWPVESKRTSDGGQARL
jgi:putative transposase